MTKLTEQLKQGADQAWETLAESWREFGARASSAFTHFRPAVTTDDSTTRAAGWMSFGKWAFMGADVFDIDDKVIVRLEAPGMRREDFIVELHDNLLSVRGEKRSEKETMHGRYRAVQCAYGSFRRDITLPVSVKADEANATYRDGVLRIELPKADGVTARRHAVAVS